MSFLPSPDTPWEMLKHLKRFIPCGCYAWKLGTAEGSVPCPYHAATHLFDAQATDSIGGHVFSTSPVLCDCLECTTMRLGRESAWDYVTDLWEQMQAEAKRKTGAVDRDESGHLCIDVESCGCAWQRCEGVWRLPSPCETHRQRVDVRELERNKGR